jgi:hypothetical protein
LDIGIIVLVDTSVKFALVSIIMFTIPSNIHGNQKMLWKMMVWRMHPSMHLGETKQKSHQKKDDRQADRFYGKYRTQKPQKWKF